MISRRSNSSKRKENRKEIEIDSDSEPTIEEIQEQQDKEFDKYNYSKRFFENTYYYFSYIWGLVLCFI